METKRFIGNDMARIFARVRRELGADAVIVQTRSLLREGADPLIEVLASVSAGGEDALTLALQRAMVQGSLDRVESAGASRGLTIGDLEEIAERERIEEHTAREFDDAYAAQAEPQAQPEWLEGFVSAGNNASPAVGEAADQLPAALEALLYEDDHDFPAPAALEPFTAPGVEAPAPIEWSPRPRIVTRNEPIQPAPSIPGIRRDTANASMPQRPFSPVEPGAAGALLAAGFSSEAARRIADENPSVRDPREALEATLAAARVDYPVENQTAIITIQGAPGSGRTTALMRMALDCADSGRETILVAADGSHTGGRAQVHAYGEAIGLPVFDAFAPKDIVAAVTRAPRGACIFIDVPAGRWSPPPAPGIAHFVYVAVPAHWQPSALSTELAEYEPAHCAGAVITGTDIATGLTPALSLLVESQLGVAFLSSGRDVGTGITVADPFTLASGVFTTSTRETTNGRLAVTA